jgi:hypothetical protein
MDFGSHLRGGVLTTKDPARRSRNHTAISHKEAQKAQKTFTANLILCLLCLFLAKKSSQAASILRDSNTKDTKKLKKIVTLSEAKGLRYGCHHGEIPRYAQNDKSDIRESL